MKDIREVTTGEIIFVYSNVVEDKFGLNDRELARISNDTSFILIDEGLYGEVDMLYYGDRNLLEGEDEWSVSDYINLGFESDVEREVLAESKYGLQYRNGDIFKTLGTVNGYDKFIIMKAENERGYDIRYYDRNKENNLGRQYEYSKDELLDIGAIEYVDEDERNRKVGVYYPLYQQR